MSGNRVVWKYELIPGPQRINMPYVYRFLHVHAQAGIAYLWAEVDPDSDLAPIGFDVRATGEPVAHAAGYNGYIGTVHLGALVFHVYTSAGRN